MSATEFHPLADIFPMLGAAPLAELADDIRANGLHEPIVLHEGLILDRRNRAIALAPRLASSRASKRMKGMLRLHLWRRRI